MLLRGAAVLVLLALTSCASPLASQPSSSEPTATESRSTMPSPSPSATPTETVTSPSATEPPQFRPGAMVRALLPGIALRIEAGLSEDRLGTLPLGSRSYVVSGPIEADGYTWIQLAGPGLPPSSGCATTPGPEFSCPAWFGWAATGDPATGDAWFVDDPTDCPDPAEDLRAFMMLGDVEALHCYGNQQIDFTGWLPGRQPLRDLGECIGSDLAAKWLWCSEEYAMRIWANDSEEISIDVYVDPKTRRQLAYPGHLPIVVGHLDDPAASDCDDVTPAGWPIDPEAVVLECRSRFVLTLLGGVGP